MLVFVGAGEVPDVLYLFVVEVSVAVEPVTKEEVTLDVSGSDVAVVVLVEVSWDLEVDDFSVLVEIVDSVVVILERLVEVVSEAKSGS